MSEVKEVPYNLVRTKEVVGVAVKNAHGEDLGKIEEIVLDKQTGQTCYIVLSFGGMLSIGDKLFALPWDIATYDPEEECFILDIDKDKLKNAPGFSKDNWPNMADRAWNESINKFYNTKSHWE
ncbi:MAG: PRC-barrel domain-containing protein [Gammaproteobacteria bacterium]|nr:PRC-barrel domain-containing protein [Gammaproteobacteria bacterium]